MIHTTDIAIHCFNILGIISVVSNSGQLISLKLYMFFEKDFFFFLCLCVTVYESFICEEIRV